MIPAGVLQGDGGAGGTIYITTDQVDLDLKALYELSFPAAVSGDSVAFICSPSLIFSSSVPSTSPTNNAPPSIRTGVWAAGVNVNLTMPSSGAIGAGGSATGPSAAAKGGTAFLVESPITVDAPGSTMSGGGGGGAGTDQWVGQAIDDYSASGGGGAGRPPGAAGTPIAADNQAPGAAGNFSSGGSGGNFGSDPNQPSAPSVIGGDGGDLGASGGDGSDVAEPGSTDNVGGEAGFSVDGLSNVTWITAPTLIGATNA